MPLYLYLSVEPLKQIKLVTDFHPWFSSVLTLKLKSRNIFFLLPYSFLWIQGRWRKISQSPILQCCHHSALLWWGGEKQRRGSHPPGHRKSRGTSELHPFTEIQQKSLAHIWYLFLSVQEDDFVARDDFEDADQLRIGNDGIFMLTFFSKV